MPSSKKPAAAANADKVMDVNSPGKAAPSASSRPVIVSHKPMVEDPMVSKKSSDAPSAPPLAGKGKTIQPPSSGGVEKPAKKSPAKKATTKPVDLAVAQEVDQDDTAKVEVSIDSSGVLSQVSAASDQEKPEQATDTSRPAEDAASVPAENKEATQTTETVEPSESPTAAKEPEESPSPESKTKDDGVAEEVEDKPSDKQSEAKAAAEAKAAKEREEKYQKLIDEKTYFVPIDQSVSSSTGGKVFMILLAIVLLGLVVAVLLIDAGIIETTFKLPFDLIQN